MRPERIRVLSLSLFALLIVWGGLVTLSFFGVPVHGRVLLSEAGWTFVSQVAGDASPLGRGIAGILPSLFHAIGRSAPFTWYVGTLVAIALGYMGWRGYKTGDVRLDLMLRPWQILAAFVFLLWLLFTVLTNTAYPQGDRPVSLRRLIEPHPSVYTSDNIEGLEVLQENFEELFARGCLRQTGTIRSDVGEYQISMGCVQQSFFTIVVPQMFFQLLLLLVFASVGRMTLRLFRLRLSDGLQELVLSMGVGASVQIVLLWLLGLVGLFVASAGWLLLGASLLASYKDARYWLTRLIYDAFPLQRAWYSFTLLCGVLLLSWFALNFLTVMRPFPIGWDDLGSYLNRPRLLVSYGSFIADMSTFQWEYLSALGYMLFGYNSVFGSTAAMTINWTAGLLATLAVMAFARRYLATSGVIAGLLYYSLPLIGHFSFADMKTDNAVFLFQALSIFTLFVFLFPQQDGDEDGQPRHRNWLLLAGLLCAIAFGTKATAIMTFFTLLAILVGVLAHWSLVVGVIAAAFVVFTAFTFNISEVAARVGWPFLTRPVFLVICAMLVAASLAYAIVRARRSVAAAVVPALILTGGFLAGIAPWLMHNNIQAGNVVPGLVLEAPNHRKPVFSFDGTSPGDAANARVLPPELAIDRSHAACQGTGRDEELGRYWGYGGGWSHYFTLPWRSVMNLDSAGYYVTTMPALLLFPLLLLLPFLWTERGRWLRWLWVGTALLTVQWVFLANGVPWYGIAMFLGLCVGLEALFQRAPDRLNRSAVLVLIVAGLVSSYSMRIWQFEQQRNLLEYPMGKASAAVMRERTISYYDDIVDVLGAQRDAHPDRPYLYRIGTFIPYFIPRNDEVIGIVDHQLDEFRCLHQEQDDLLTLQRLKALGFSSIIFDTNAATIEQDPDGPLHRKVQDFVDFLNNPSLGVQVIVNDMQAGLAFILIP